MVSTSTQHTRGAFLRRAALAGAGAGVIGLRPGRADAATPERDVEILNFALTLEELEAAFYADAIAKGALSGDVLRFAQEVGGHEQTHVETLRKTLGEAAIAKPTFDFKDATASKAAFLKTAVTLEDTGVAAYKGQAARITSTAVLKAALSIHSVEAKHAAWARRLSKGAPSPAAFEGTKTMAQVLAAVKQTGFIVGG
jgi:rubrerythrin